MGAVRAEPMYDRATAVNPGAIRSCAASASTQSAQSSPPMTLTVASISAGVAGGTSTRVTAPPPLSRSREKVVCAAPIGLITDWCVGARGIGAARRGHTVDEVVDLAAPLSKAAQDRPLGAGGEAVTIVELEPRPAPLRQGGHGPDAVPPGRCGAPARRGPLQAQPDTRDPPADQPGGRDRLAVP